MAANPLPILTAISSSARQLHSLLRCIAFTSKALVQISENGVKLSSYESSVLEGHILLERKIFTSYRYNADEPPSPFEISLPALLETLQIFSSSNDNGRDSTRFAPYYNPAKQSAFNNASLGLPNQLCTLSYAGEGTPLTVTMNDTHNDPNNFNGPGSVETTCDLTTYEPASASASQDDRDIPFRRNQLAGKIILQSGWLADALAELATTNPERVTLHISPATGFLLSATGPLGSAEVSFDASPPTTGAAGAGDAAKRSFTGDRVPRDPYAPSAADAGGNNSTGAPGAAGSGGGGGGGGVLETFLAQESSRNSYKFAHVRATLLAMKASSKTSVRVDAQGVLSLQFMIELGAEDRAGGGGGGGGSGEMSFVDFRFVPLVDDEDGMVDGRVGEGPAGPRGVRGGDESTASEDG